MAEQKRDDASLGPGVRVAISGVQPATHFALDELDDAILKGIGKIVSRWGYLQYQLGVIIRVAMGLKDDKARVLTGGMEVGVLLGVLRTIAHKSNDQYIKNPKMREAIRDFLDDVQKGSEHRNDYAHGVFGYTDETPTRFSRLLWKSGHHRIKPQWEPITAEHLETLATEARTLWVRAQVITKQLKGRAPQPT
jgi:hypothetical protein